MKTIDLHIVDIVHNSIRANADVISIIIIDSKKNNSFKLTIKDNGSGIESKTMEKIQKSFFSSRKERNIGMGLALLKFHAELCNGCFVIESEVGKGTIVKAEFQKDHFDMQPIGDIAGTVTRFMCQYQNINFIFKYYKDDDEFEISSKDVQEVFGNSDLNNAMVISKLSEYLRSQFSDE